MRHMCNPNNECNVLFSPRTVFPTRFSDEVFNEACAYRGNRLRGSVVKHTNFYPRRKGEGILILVVRMWVFTKLLGLGRAIYTWELYVVIINIQRNKE